MSLGRPKAALELTAESSRNSPDSVRAFPGQNTSYVWKNMTRILSDLGLQAPEVGDRSVAQPID